MGNLPQASVVSFSKGIWFVHHERGRTFRVWLSMLTGRERVYLQDRMVSDRRNATQVSTIHHFTDQQHWYEVEIFTRNLSRAEFECSILQDGHLLASYLHYMEGPNRFAIRQLVELQPIRKRAGLRYKRRGKYAIQDFDLEEAERFLVPALRLGPADPDIHFLLAALYSLTERKQQGLEHLEQAVRLDERCKIRSRTDDNLAFLRIQPEFEHFARKYQL